MLRGPVIGAISEQLTRGLAYGQGPPYLYIYTTCLHFKDTRKVVIGNEAALAFEAFIPELDPKSEKESSHYHPDLSRLHSIHLCTCIPLYNLDSSLDPVSSMMDTTNRIVDVANTCSSKSLELVSGLVTDVIGNMGRGKQKSLPR
jgi:hypothetical protein